MFKQVVRTHEGMQILPLNFFIYAFSGVWRPVGWQSNVTKLLYKSFTFCIIISLYFLMLSQFMDIVFVVDNIDDFINNSLIFVTVVAVCCKATIAVTRRNAIIDLVHVLSNEPFSPRDEDEVAIRMKFDEFIRSCTKKILLLTAYALTGGTVGSLLNMTQGQLPYRVWLPFDRNASLTFWIVSIQQIVTMSLAAIINVGTETLVFGFFLQTCAQLEMFEVRLHKLVLDKVAPHPKYFSPFKEEAAISEYISHHLKIYKYARTVNGIFNEVFFVQFFGSTLVLCISMYYLSVHITEFESATLILYTMAMFVQIFLYCWSGNEVILKSANIGNVIYHMDWPSLSASDRRNILMIMRRSTVPIKFTSSFLITFSLESYSNILKTSYTAFNVLQQS